MSDVTSDELKQEILEYLKTVSKAKNRDVAKALDKEKRMVDKAIGELATEGKIEYLYLNGSYVTLKQ
ncbi:MAG TPA: hypothetical protein PK544_11895 [Spirochaetota bacterium]|nr:hypothetical protein [Spirochaetota bacterium]HPJ37079.1 hypothetical protein [Spirochaetota bacterium]HPQ53428.1 hypothetical protein [Spirochaetota bacterium]